MTQAPNTFVDPVERPVRFVQRVPSPIFAFGESSFPVSFSFDTSPRDAAFAGAAASQLGVFLTDKNAYSDPVVQAAYGQPQAFVLSAVGSDVSTADFFLTTERTDGTRVATAAYGLAEVRQPSFWAGIGHSFSTHASALGFDPVLSGGDYYWPVATMILTPHRMLSSGTETLPTVATSKDADTTVVLAPASAWGIVDVEIDVSIDWYDDEARTSPSGSHPTVDAPRFGLRLYVSKPDVLSSKVAASGRTCVVGSLYPTTVLMGLGGDSVSLAYWGVGADGNGMFWGREDGIEVSSNGLALQDGSETASYVLANPLDDYDTSSSSSSSPSSLNSSSSTSSLLNSSPSSPSSQSTPSSPSSRSSSSRSTMSSVSSSSSSPSSRSSSSVTDSSSSTDALLLDSSSSVVAGSGMSSSSSVEASVVARFSFSEAQDEFGVVADESGNGNSMSVGTVSGGLGPPSWDGEAGVSGGGMVFFADASNSDYLASASADWTSGMRTIAFWARCGSSGNPVGVPFCVSNGFVPTASKSEVAVQLDSSDGSVAIWARIDGELMWQASTAAGLLSAGAWAHVAVVHDGSEPAVYVDGVPAALTFSADVDRAAWTGDALAASSPADRVVVGGAPRHYAPFVALGFSGTLDEITVWDAALSGGAILAEFAKGETYSSASSTSLSSASSESSEG